MIGSGCSGKNRQLWDSEKSYFATATLPLGGSSGHAIMALTHFGLRLTASGSQDADLGSIETVLNPQISYELHDSTRLR